MNNAFRALLDPHVLFIRNIDRQGYAKERFPSVVASSNLSLIDTRKPIPSDCEYYRVGIAAFSIPDLRLLDRLDEFLATSDTDIKIDVMNLDELHQSDLLSNYFPCAKNDSHWFHPIVSKWKDGAFIGTYVHAQGLPIDRE